MSKINLLPWREELRTERKKQFFITVGIAAVVAAGVWGLVHFYHTQLISNQQARNKFLEDQIVLLDKKIEEIKRLEREKERLLARMRAIEQLQGNRPLIVRLFDEIVSGLPEGMSLTKVQQKGNIVTLSGIAQSNARVSSFMRSLDNSEWVKNPELDIIQVDKQDKAQQRINNFTLRLTQVVPSASTEEEDE